MPGSDLVSEEATMKKTVLFGSTAIALMLAVSSLSAQDRQRGEGMQAPAGQSPGGHQMAPASGPAGKSSAPDKSNATEKSGDRLPGRSAQSPQREQAAPSSAQAPNQAAKPEGAAPKSAQGKELRGQDLNRPASAGKDQSQLPSAQKNEPSKPSSAQSIERKAAPTNAQRNEQNKPASAQSQPSATQQRTTGQNQLPGDKSSTSGSTTTNASANASVNLNTDQRMRITQSMTRLNVRPENNVNFSVRIGADVPRSLRVRPLPREIVDVVPQYRGYDFVAVRDEIIIVEPRTRRIVTTLPYGGAAQAQAGVQRRSSLGLSQQQRTLIKQRMMSNQPSSGAAPTTQIIVGETLPDTIVIERFPEVVYQDVPVVREYQYVVKDNDIYVVDPRERRVIDVIE
jgi:hypothetical protein